MQEVRKLSWGGSQKYRTTQVTIPKKFMAAWLKDGQEPTHVQLSQDDYGTVTVVPVTWPQDEEQVDPVKLMQQFQQDGLDLCQGEIEGWDDEQ